jgi:hypothetical protein
LGLPHFSSEDFLLAKEQRFRYRIFGHGFGLAGIIAFVKCGASAASDFNGGDRHFGGRKLILLLWGYKRSTSLKTSHPHGLSLHGKEYGPKEKNAWIET